MHTHVSLQVTLGGEHAATQLAVVGSLAGMSAVVHLQGAATAQHALTHDTLVGVR